jgi:hypothetical protein
MAHIGRPGPYVARRDFNLNVNNNTFGFYRRVICTVGGLPPGVGNALNGVPFDCGPDFYPGVFTLRWLSNFSVAVPFLVRCIISVTIPTGINYSRQIEFDLGVGAPILTLQTRRQEFDIAPGWSLPDGWEVVFYDPGYFDSEPEFAGATVDNKLWTDGPPH